MNANFFGFVCWALGCLWIRSVAGYFGRLMPSSGSAVRGAGFFAVEGAEGAL